MLGRRYQKKVFGQKSSHFRRWRSHRHVTRRPRITMTDVSVKTENRLSHSTCPILSFCKCMAQTHGSDPYSLLLVRVDAVWPEAAVCRRALLELHAALQRKGRRFTNVLSPDPVAPHDAINERDDAEHDAGAGLLQ